MEVYKNRYMNINKNQGNTSTHKRALSSYDNSNNISKQFNYNNPMRNNRQNKSFINSKYNRDKSKQKKNGSLKDYKRLAKKYYSIIIGLQDELTKQTIKVDKIYISFSHPYN